MTAVSRSWRATGPALAGAYRASLVLAVRHHVHRLAFPAISNGIDDFPKARAAA
ncbi:MAG: macro domain-containing protein [Stellaceae bacterium]